MLTQLYLALTTGTLLLPAYHHRRCNHILRSSQLFRHLSFRSCAHHAMAKVLFVRLKQKRGRLRLPN